MITNPQIRMNNARAAFGRFALALVAAVAACDKGQSYARPPASEYTVSRMPLATSSAVDTVQVATVTPEFLRVSGVRAVLGRLFIADTGNHRLVKLNPDGTLDVLAGTGTSGSPVNGGKARSATLHKPEGVAVDAQGNLFVSDAENRVVQKINGLGIISIVVGNGQFGYSGDGGPAVRATLATPHDLKIDRGGNLIIADWGIGPHRQRLRRVSPDGIISSILPEGADALKIVQPQCLALDNLGNILVGDGDTDRVWKIHPDGTVTLVAGAEHSDRSQKDYYAAPAPGTPLNTTLNDPRGVAADTHGNIFISDSANHRVLKVDLNGLIRVVAGNGKKTYQGEGYYSGDGGPAVKASLSFPAGLLVDTKGNLFIVDSGNNRVRKVNAEGVIMTVAGY